MGVFVRVISTAIEIILRCEWSAEARAKATHNLMQHERLSVKTNRDPFDIAIHLGFPNFERQHVAFDRLLLEILADGIVVKVARVSAMAASTTH